MSSADIVDEFAYSHQTWAVEFLEGWKVFGKLHFSYFLPFYLQMIQKSGYGESLQEGPESSWLGYSLLPEGAIL